MAHALCPPLSWNLVSTIRKRATEHVLPERVGGA